MAQRVIKGVNGSFSMTLGTVTVTGRMFRWEANYTQDANDATGFGSTWQQREFGLQRLTGRVVGYLTGGTVNDRCAISAQQVKASMTLTADSSCVLTGSAIVTGIRVIADENTNDGLAFEFANDGTWLETQS